jgi:hypothetical protein
MYLDSREASEFGRHRESAEEIELYDYVRQIVKQPDREAIDKFYKLLLEAITYPEQSVQEALKKIVLSPEFEQTGKYVINRCFYTVGNPLLQIPARHATLYEIISCADRTRPQALEKWKITWQKQLENYFASDLYLALKRQMRLLEDSPDFDPLSEDGTFGKALKRYPFVHEAVAVTEDVPQSLRAGIRQARVESLIRLNQQLNTYVNHDAKSSDKTVLNPTWIPDAELEQAFSKYRPDQEKSLLIQSSDFFHESQTFVNLGQLRQAFSSYLREPLVEANSQYKSGGFLYRLNPFLQQGGDDEKPVNAVSISIICQRVLQFLIVRDIQHSSHAELKNLIQKVGHEVVTAMLLRIVLFCRRVCPWLESRFGILLHIYEDKPKREIDWVVQAFEHMNVALALNYQPLGYHWALM